MKLFLVYFLSIELLCYFRRVHEKLLLKAPPQVSYLFKVALRKFMKLPRSVVKFPSLLYWQCSCSVPNLMTNSFRSYRILGTILKSETNDEKHAFRQPFWSELTELAKQSGHGLDRFIASFSNADSVCTYSVNKPHAMAGERLFSNGHVGAAIETSIYNRYSQRPIAGKGTKCAAFLIALNSHSIRVY